MDLLPLPAAAEGRIQLHAPDVQVRQGRAHHHRSGFERREIVARIHVVRRDKHREREGKRFQYGSQHGQIVPVAVVKSQNNFLPCECLFREPPVILFNGDDLVVVLQVSHLPDESIRLYVQTLYPGICLRVHPMIEQHPGSPVGFPLTGGAAGNYKKNIFKIPNLQNLAFIYSCVCVFQTKNTKKRSIYRLETVPGRPVPDISIPDNDKALNNNILPRIVAAAYRLASLFVSPEKYPKKMERFFGCRIPLS